MARQRNCEMAIIAKIPKMDRDEKTEKKSFTTNHEKMMALISLQTAEGYFKKDKMMEDILGKPLDELKIGSSDEKIDENVWLTAIVIAFFEENFIKEKYLWEMAIDKAKLLVKNNKIMEEARKKVKQI